MRLGVAAALVGGRRLPGDVLLEDRRVTRVGMAPRGSSGLAIPGFVDLQVNGFAGVDVLGADRDGYRRMGEALAATGVTAYQPTIISSPLDAYGPALARVIDAGPTPGGRVFSACTSRAHFSLASGAGRTARRTSSIQTCRPQVDSWLPGRSPT